MSHKLPETEPMRRCIHCEHERPLDKFYGGKRTCKSCMVALQSQRRKGEQLSDISEYFDRWKRVI